jgi:hypothetical protein
MNFIRVLLLLLLLPLLLLLLLLLPLLLLPLLPLTTSQLTWSINCTTAQLTPNRARPIVVATNNSVLYLAGGRGVWDGQPVDTAQGLSLLALTPVLPDPPPLPHARWDMVAAVLHGQGLVFWAGGTNESNATTHPAPSAVVDILNTTDLTWTSTQLSAARKHVSAGTVEDLAVFAGGDNSAVVDIYDASEGLWSTAALSAPRGRVGIATVGHRMFLAGGARSDDAVSDVVDVFDSRDNTWSPLAPLSEARAHVTGHGVWPWAIFVGGFTWARAGVQAPSATIDILDVRDLRWLQPAHRLSQPRSGLTVAVWERFILFGGGGQQNLEIFDTRSLSWSNVRPRLSLFIALSTPVPGLPGPHFFSTFSVNATRFACRCNVSATPARPAPAPSPWTTRGRLFVLQETEVTQVNRDRDPRRRSLVGMRVDPSSLALDRNIVYWREHDQVRRFTVSPPVHLSLIATSLRSSRPRFAATRRATSRRSASFGVCTTRTTSPRPGTGHLISSSQAMGECRLYWTETGAIWRGSLLSRRVENITSVVTPRGLLTWNSSAFGPGRSRAERNVLLIWLDWGPTPRIRRFHPAKAHVRWSGWTLARPKSSISSPRRRCLFFLVRQQECGWSDPNGPSCELGRGFRVRLRLLERRGRRVRPIPSFLRS